MEMSARVLLVVAVCFLAVPLMASLVHDGVPSVDGGMPSSTAPNVSTSENLATRLRKFARGLMQHVPPSVMKRLLQAPLSTECSLGLLRTLRGLSNMEAWAMRMLDSSGKVPGGVFIGSVTELGSFDECLNTVVKDESGTEIIRAQYCSFYLRAGNDTTIIELLKPAGLMTHPKAGNLANFLNDPRVPGLRWGICVISDCSPEDLEAVGSALIGVESKVSVKYCTTGLPPEPTTAQVVVMVLLAVIALLMAAGTIVDICTSKERKSSGGLAVLRCFSVPANLRMLGARTRKDSPSYALRFMHGIRAVSIYYVVYGHATFEFSFSSGGMAFMMSYLDRYDSVITGATYLVVDTFFFMSGYLLFYVLNTVKNVRGAKSTAVIILRRWYRLLIPLLVAACSFSLLPLVVTGPTTSMVYDKFYDDVRNNWWTFVFNMQNLYRHLAYVGAGT